MSLDSARRQLVAIGAAFDARGWVPATSGNFSARLDDGRIAVTSSGRHKGRLIEADIMTVDGEGRSLDGGKPSAETGLHTQLYCIFPEIGAVLHTHSPGGVALSRAFPDLDAWIIEGHELVKALPGQTTHEARVVVPIVANDQDMNRLAAAVEPHLLAKPAPPAYLIRGHGLYAWGADVAEAERVVEALEWLFAADLTERQYRMGAKP
ncbi:MAG TPA: methylthioribulose 1-phosphate dehydratase [Caulobacteraceae bacterium]